MSAVISECGRYRYRLDRSLVDGLFGSVAAVRRIAWVMLNPSTANATADDPTMRRVIAFSRAFGFSHLTVVNLFALRSPKPAALLESADPLGPDCDAHIVEVLGHSSAVICAWGASVPDTHSDRPDAVLAMIRDAQHVPFVLGTTADGSPRHPLYLPADARMRAWGGR